MEVVLQGAHNVGVFNVRDFASAQLLTAVGFRSELEYAI